MVKFNPHPTSPKKSDKNNFRNIPKSYVLLQTMTKTPAKFQKAPSITVGIASTRYPPFILFELEK